MKNKSLVIMPFTLPWNWSADFQRQTCLELVSRGYQVVCYLENDGHFFLKSKSGDYEQIAGINFYQPTHFLPFGRITLIDQLNKRLSLLILNLKYLHRKKIIWIFDPRFHFLPKIFNRQISIYDCVDYQSSFLPITEKQFRLDEEKLIQAVDAMFVNSQTLYNLHQHKTPKLFLVAQGFNEREFSLSKPRKIKKNSEITVGYIGGINHRFDFKLLYYLIKNQPNWQFEFIGQVQKDEQDEILHTQSWLKILKKFPNTKWSVAKNKSELIKSMQNFTVGIIPYDTKQPLNFYAYPMKVFEYFYLGLPVVSTALGEFKQEKFKELLAVATDHKSWRKAIISFYHQPGSAQIQADRRQLAISNSWQNKINQILKQIDSLSEQKDAKHSKKLRPY